MKREYQKVWKYGTSLFRRFGRNRRQGPRQNVVPSTLYRRYSIHSIQSQIVTVLLRMMDFVILYLFDKYSISGR